jgi:hypothetical protein
MSIPRIFHKTLCVGLWTILLCLAVFGWWTILFAQETDPTPGLDTEYPAGDITRPVEWPGIFVSHQTDPEQCQPAGHSLDLRGCDPDSYIVYVDRQLCCSVERLIELGLGIDGIVWWREAE